MTRSRKSLKSPVRPTTASEVMLTVQEAAKAIKVTDRTILNWINDGLLTGYRFGPKIIRIDRAELLELGIPFGGRGVA
ncbi:helix-turn-helix domain-containing protein [Nocardia huaxiensis]|uniref:helix-turn-helix domain-containing protein n=1 Tax=Nocardia huaxiensis TaxID=2755382 RepID=UPI001E388CE8|nr:helix-turn-helix domain-containing protein [Nocardia huaxiensis]UFS99113.1 helix-turn-helix domain-containing protein [Nocardia huaxiensis]